MLHPGTLTVHQEPRERAEPEPVGGEESVTVPQSRLPRAPTQLSVLTGFQVYMDGRSVALPPNVERVLALLAVRAVPQGRHHVASTLWMDTTCERAAANLRTALWKCRQSLADCIYVRGSYLSLAPWVQVDLAAVVRRAHRLLDEEGLEGDDWHAAQLTGDLLPDWDEEWLTFERERLRQLRIHALEQLCCKLSAVGRPGRAVEAGLAAVAAEPLR